MGQDRGRETRDFMVREIGEFGSGGGRLFLPLFGAIELKSLESRNINATKFSTFQQRFIIYENFKIYISHLFKVEFRWILFHHII